MFYRFDTWIIAFILLWIAIGGTYAYVSGLKKQLKAEKKQNDKLRVALLRKCRELHKAQADAEVTKNFILVDKNDLIEMLREQLKASNLECKRLETLLEQKWEGASKTKGAKKNDVSK